MFSAKCTEDGVNYTAFDFSKLPVGDLERKRHFLICQGCGRSAFFRKKSRSGRAACFGASHDLQCEYASPEYNPGNDGPGEPQDQLYNPGNRIVVDFNYGAAGDYEVQEDNRLPENRGRRGRYQGNGQRPNARTHRRLRPLLRDLINVEAFRNSEQIIEIHGQPEIAVRDFFVPFLNVTNDNEGLFRGYWGEIVSVRRSENGTLWLNSGNRQSISFYIDDLFINDAFDHYGIQNDQDFVGAFLLVLAEPLVSQNNKIYCDISRHGNTAIILPH